MRYDVIIVGARVAGAATAMLLARAGLRVLAVDRVAFPSDTISSHQVQVPGVALLRRWGLLDRLIAAGTPPTRRVRFDPGHVVLDANFPACGGVEALYSPRRTLLDALLVDAAREAGAEVLEGVRVERLTFGDGGRVSGVNGTMRGGGSVTATARLVVGADGKHSMVAAQARARSYRVRAARAFACYGYVADLPVTTGEIYQRPGRAVAVFPTNDDLTMVYVSGPLADFERFRRDIKGSFLATLDRCGDLGERVRGGRLAERLRTTPDQPNLFRAASGPGWALVGDAGVVMDSITAQGITNALRDADRLATAVVAGLGGEPLGSGPASAGPPDPGFAGARALGSALAGHGRRRDRDIRAMFDFTVDIAGFRPLTALQRQLFASLAGRPAEIDRFLGAFAGITPVDEYFSTGNAARLIGPRGLLRAATTWVHGAAVPMPRTA